MGGDGEERVLFCSCAFCHALGLLVTPFIHLDLIIPKS